MANKEQLAILSQGVEAWNDWRKQNPDARVNLRGHSFKGKDLSQVNFSHANIQGANFTNAKLIGANFSGAKAGLQRCWTISLLVMSLLLLLLSALIGVLCGAYLEALFSAPFSVPNIFSGAVILLIYILFLVNFFHSKLIKSIIIVAVLIVTYISIAIVGTYLISSTITVVGDITKLSSSATFANGKPVVINPIIGGTSGIVSTSFASSVFAVSGFTPIFITAVVISIIGLGITEIILKIPVTFIVIPIIVFASNQAFHVRGIADIVSFATQYLGGYIASTLTPNKYTSFATSYGFVHSTSDLYITTKVVAVTIILLSAFIAQKILLLHKDYILFRKILIAVTATGGTNFNGADLTDANFTHAKLKSTNFRRAILTRSRWYQAKGLEYIRPGTTYLEKVPVRLLVITGKGQNKSFEHFDLQGVNLEGAKLSGANFIGVNLNKANLENADLSKANLKQAQLDQVKLTGACLTGACIENWNINGTTNLDDVVCDYVYLRENQQERRPHSGTFTPGDLAKLVQDSLNTVDLIFEKGVDWKAFTYSFHKTQIENEGTPLAVQSIENKGDGVVLIKVSVPHDIDKGKIFNDFRQAYEFAQEALELSYKSRFEDKEKEINRLFYLVNQLQNQLSEVPKVMSEANKQYTFHAPVGSVENQGNIASSGNQNSIGNAAGEAQAELKSIQHIHNYAPEQKQTLAEAAAEIQQLLKKLETQGYSPEAAQQKVADDLAAKAKQDSTVKEKLVKWGQSLGDAAAKTTVTEAAKEALKLALRLSGIPIP
ncbi:pentapeptide repeat-containing protein [Coleofasciculus sp.]|uniref:pentapeptide repeat-containing protein n=1 Tax=Coleofasciculus sp. TaxID=3100458 RepID=UPI0039F909BA